MCAASVRIDLILCNVICKFSTLRLALLLQQKANEGVMNSVCKYSEGESPDAGKLFQECSCFSAFHVHLIMQRARKGRSTKYQYPAKRLLQRRQVENREDSKWLLD